MLFAVSWSGLLEYADHGSDREQVGATFKRGDVQAERDIGVHKARVQPTIDHQHRSRLRGWMQLLPEVGACFEHPGPLARDVENAVRLHVEVAPARSGVGTNKFTAIFYVKTNGLLVGVEHPSIGGEDELP